MKRKKHFFNENKKLNTVCFGCPQETGCTSGFNIEIENKKIICEFCKKDITKEALPFLQDGWDNPSNY